MPMHSNIGGGVAHFDLLYANVGGTQKSISSAFGNISGSQKEIFNIYKSKTLSSCTNGSTVYINDSEGLSPYTVLGGYYQYNTGTTGTLLWRDNALNYNFYNDFVYYISDSMFYDKTNTPSIYGNLCRYMNDYCLSSYKNSLPSSTLSISIAHSFGDTISETGISYSLHAFPLIFGASASKPYNRKVVNLSGSYTYSRLKNGTAVDTWYGEYLGSDYDYDIGNGYIGYRIYVTNGYDKYSYKDIEVVTTPDFSNGPGRITYAPTTSMYLRPVIFLNSSTTVYTLN